MKYQIGDLFKWNYPTYEISTLIEIYMDKNGTKRYKLKSYIREGLEDYIKESYTEEEINNLIKTNVLIYYPVK